MPEINQLNSIDTPSPGDLFPIFSRNNSDARKLSLYNLMQYILTEINSSDSSPFIKKMENQKYTPSVNGFTLQVNNSFNDVHLYLLNGTAHSGVIYFPSVQNCIDGQEILINSTVSINPITFNGNGATIVNAPNIMSEIWFYCRFVYDLSTYTWYRVG
jgi:hypothetical protein